MGKIRVLAWLVILVIILEGGWGSVEASSSPESKIDARVLDDTANGKSGNFLVVLAQQTDLQAEAIQALDARQRPARVTGLLRQTAEASQPPVVSLLEALARSRAVTQYHSYWVANLIAVQGNRQAVEALAARQDVERIVTDRAFEMLPDDTNTPLLAASGVEANLTQVHAPEMWSQGITGRGMVYASADTGVDWDHPALIGQYRGWDGTLANHNYSWWDAIHQDLSGDGSNPCGFSSPVPCDDENHGTHVMGIGVGDDGAGNQIGMAPGARWIACRNMDEGVGRPSTYIECLQFFMAPWDLNGQNPDPTRHADVISNSYSCPTSEGCIDPGVLHEVVNNVRAAGIFMAVSAGNDGPGCGTVNTPPALEDDVTTVGAVSSSDAIAPFSSWGPVMVDGSGLRKPDLVAPGVGVRSSIPVGKIYGADYSAMSGTSMAAPHVAGAVALLWSAIPALRGEVAATEQLLESSAQPLYPSAGQLCGTDTLQSSPNNVYGFGLLNVLAAYRDTFHYSYYFPLIYEGNY